MWTARRRWSKICRAICTWVPRPAPASTARISVCRAAASSRDDLILHPMQMDDARLSFCFKMALYCITISHRPPCCDYSSLPEILPAIRGGGCPKSEARRTLPNISTAFSLVRRRKISRCLPSKDMNERMLFLLTVSCCLGRRSRGYNKESGAL